MPVSESSTERQAKERSCGSGSRFSRKLGFGFNLNIQIQNPSFSICRQSLWYVINIYINIYIFLGSYPSLVFIVSRIRIWFFLEGMIQFRIKVNLQTGSSALREKSGGISRLGKVQIGILSPRLDRIFGNRTVRFKFGQFFAWFQNVALHQISGYHGLSCAGPKKNLTSPDFS